MVLTKRLLPALFIAAIALFSHLPASHAADFGSLISPGELGSFHSELDGLSNCTKCHTKGEGLPNANCTVAGCHAGVAAAQAIKKGLHGGVADQPCVKCHKDHKGRGYRGTEGDIKKFDHATTGYKLAGKHAPVACAKCHTAKTKKGLVSYAGLDTACFSCHKKDDIHKGTLKEKCENCHTTNGWKGKDVTFDHDKAYKLEGKHIKVECKKCHAVKGIFQVENKEQCITCHKKDDKHKGGLGPKCESCHVPATWKEIRFDHKQTKYPLTGKHVQAPCEKCHVERAKGVFKIGKYDTCDAPGCHDKGKFGNVHGKQFAGKKCDECHTTQDFKPATFKHEDPAYTGYKLKGKHAKLECEKCHRPDQVTKAALFKPIPSDRCDNAGCHDIKERGNIHGPQFKGQLCDSCHHEENWKPSLFDHSAAAYKGYKLKGKHAKLECEKCHRPDQVTKAALFKPIPSDRCDNAGCHDIKSRGNIHGSQFKGQLCDSCHHEENWKPSLFDHNAAAYKGYRLEGKHAAQKCEKCHRPDPLTQTVLFKPMAADRCDNAGCHDIKERGNIHGPQFKDAKCEQCHTPKEWKPSLFDHNAAAYKGYKLEGKHANTKCDKCHKINGGGIQTFRGIDAKSCSSAYCHKDPHAGQFRDKACEQCHTPKDWKELNFNHNTQARFPLEGKHIAAKCDKCHEGKVWKPVKSECLDCHRKDDDKAHKGKMGPKCEQCHTAANWEPKSFFHEVTGFALQGAHTQIVCSDCHKAKGVFTGLGPDCVKCHTDPHYNQFGPAACGQCHTAKNWFPEKFRHTETGFRLEGGHRAATCEQCHQARNYRNTPQTCYLCHAADFNRPAALVFHGSGNTNCVTCHKMGAFDWLGASFTHLTMTFTGSHAAVKNDCLKCHSGTGSTLSLKWPGTTLESQCFNCHTNNPAGMAPNLTYQSKHGGAVPCPTNCTLCHTTSTFLNPAYSGPACN